MLSSSSSTSSDLPRRVIREPESSRPRTRPPLSWPLPRASSSSVMPDSATLRELGAHHREHLVELGGQAADRDPDQAGVDVLAGEGEDGVGQAALLADLLEQPARRAAAERGVEHAEGEAARSSERVSPFTPEHDVDLLELTGRLDHARTPTRRAVATWRRDDRLGGAVEEAVAAEGLADAPARARRVVDVAGDGHDHPLGAVVAPVEAQRPARGSSPRSSRRCRRSGGRAASRPRPARRRGCGRRRRGRRRASRSRRGSRHARPRRRRA